jgi:hypothetical protein
MTPKGRRRVLILLTLMVVAVLFWQFLGFYSVQPIGALPEGATLLVRRIGDEPFFNSPDGTCLRRVGSVSLMCRMAALANAPIDRIVLRLPYMAWAYRASTGGAEFDR